MSHLDILLPFGLPPPEFAADLLRQVKTPALAMLLSRTIHRQCHSLDEFSRTLPHEAWLANRLGLPAMGQPSMGEPKSTSSPAIASAAMQAYGLTADSGTWFVVQPVYLHVARDHLVLTDRRQLRVTDPESRQLFEIAKTTFAHAGKELLYGEAKGWFVRADDWADLQTSTPDAACGHNVDIWMPRGTHELAWRRLQNEIQMEWHTHPVNAARESNGLKPVNSIWLWGGASHETALPNHIEFDAKYWTVPTTAQANAADMIAALASKKLVVLDSLTEATLANDWSTWLEQMQQLEHAWFVPVLQALKSGPFRTLSLILNDHARLLEIETTRRSLQKFWVKPSLESLAA